MLMQSWSSLIQAKANQNLNIVEEVSLCHYPLRYIWSTFYNCVTATHIGYCMTALYFLSAWGRSWLPFQSNVPKKTGVWAPAKFSPPSFHSFVTHPRWWQNTHFFIYRLVADNRADCDLIFHLFPWLSSLKCLYHWVFIPAIPRSRNIFVLSTLIFDFFET